MKISILNMRSILMQHQSDLVWMFHVFFCFKAFFHTKNMLPTLSFFIYITKNKWKI
jgi:hypothetical protein